MNFRTFNIEVQIHKKVYKTVEHYAFIYYSFWSEISDLGQMPSAKTPFSVNIK